MSDSKASAKTRVKNTLFAMLLYLADAKGEEKYPLQFGENAKQKVC